MPSSTAVGCDRRAVKLMTFQDIVQLLTWILIDIFIEECPVVDGTTIVDGAIVDYLKEINDIDL